jgi:hypothetical protein
MYDYGPANLVGRPRCVTFWGQCALVALPACSRQPEFYVRNEGLHVGCTPNGPTKYFQVLGRFCSETFLRSACLEWLCQTLCSYAGYLHVSSLHMFKINIALPSFIVDNLFMRRAPQIPTGYPRILAIDDLRPLWGRHAYKTSSRSAVPDSLHPCLEIWVSLHFVWSRPWLNFLLVLEHQTSHAVCFNAQGLLYECVFDALLFSSSYRPVGKPISHHVVTQPTLSPYFLDHHAGHPARHDARILLYEFIFDAL